MRTKTPAEVVKALEFHIIARYGVPLELRMDRGLEFAGEVTKLCERLNIKRTRISVQYPQSNGQAERYVGVVKRALITMLSEGGVTVQDWDDLLPAILMGMRFLQQKVLGYSPFTVVHGLVPRVPLQKYQLLESIAWEEREFNTEDLMATLQFIHEEVLDKIKLADMRSKAQFDAK